VNDGIDAGQGGRQVLRPREVADDGTGAVQFHIHRSAKQDPEAITALWQFAKKMPADEARSTGERYERPGR
jgi:hypothetical protein